MKGGLRVLIKDKLEPEELKLLCESYDIVGDVAGIRIPEPLTLESRFIAAKTIPNISSSRVGKTNKSQALYTPINSFSEI